MDDDQIDALCISYVLVGCSVRFSVEWNSVSRNGREVDVPFSFEKKPHLNNTPYLSRIGSLGRLRLGFVHLFRSFILRWQFVHKFTHFFFYFFEVCRQPEKCFMAHTLYLQTQTRFLMRVKLNGKLSSRCNSNPSCLQKYNATPIRQIRIVVASLSSVVCG
jgi:hypothetical protein